MSRTGWKSGWAGGLAVAVALLAARPAETQAPAPGPQDLSTGDASRLFDAACAPCHGRLGNGEGRGARLLGRPQPRDFTPGVFKFRSTPTGSLPTDQDIFRTISRGVPGTWMPAWEDLLTQKQRWALVRYIKGFSEYFAEEEPDPPVEIPPEPGYSATLEREGRFVYAALKCWQCHGPRGRGDGPSAGELEDDWGAKIRPYDFTRGRYKNGSTPSDLYRTLVTGLSGTPMPEMAPQNVLFPGGAGTDAGPMREGVAPEEFRELQAYLADQPTLDQIRALREEEAEELVRRRLWALVYYLQSLERPVGALQWLFGTNPELDRGGGP
ncbi:MAG: c-type cytochrome [Gemmatimonadota bacterium]